MQNADEQSRSLESIARRTCEVCGRTDLVSQPGPDAFVKWKVIEGTLCPRCARGPARVMSTTAATCDADTGKAA
jgi:hypothetical protein